MTVALIVGIGGSIMYSFAAVGGLYILLISRVIIGFSTGMGAFLTVMGLIR